MTTRLVAGALVAAMVAMAAYRMRALTAGGACAAAGIGTCAILAGWVWGGLLVAFFVTSVAWSRLGAAFKTSRTSPVIAPAEARNAVQVMANGGAFAAAALLFALAGDGTPGVWTGEPLLAFAFGALAAATADTWATEIGLLARPAPRSLLSWRRVSPGASGGVTLIGTTGGCAGAAMISAGASLGGLGTPVAFATLAGGIAGMLTDSLLGASLQATRWCDTCRASTERRTHSCGQPTRHGRGLRWLDNDGVNAASTVAGAAAGSLTLFALRGGAS